MFALSAEVVVIFFISVCHKHVTTAAVVLQPPDPPVSPVDCTPSKQERLSCYLFLESRYCTDPKSIPVHTNTTSTTQIKVSDLVSHGGAVYNKSGDASNSSSATVPIATSWLLSAVGLESSDRLSGFLLKYFHTSDDEIEEIKCFYLKVSLSDTNKSAKPLGPIQLDITISLDIKSRFNPADWYAELYILPQQSDRASLTADVRQGFALSRPKRRVDALTSTIDTLPTTSSSPVFDLNLTVTSEKPYSIRIKFQKYSPFPRHLSYGVYVDNDDDTVSKYINGSNIPPIKVPKSSSTDDYADVLIEGVHPGRKFVYIYPKVRETDCIGDWCRQVSDYRHQVSDYIKVGGRDYVPRTPPSLEQHSAQRLDVTFYAAPNIWYFTDYDVELRLAPTETNGETQLLAKRRVPYQVPSSSWSALIVRFGMGELLFSLDDNTGVYATVAPVMQQTICGRPGFCNVNGTCVGCAQSYSGLLYYRTSTSTTEASRIANLELIGITPIPLVLVILIAVCCLYKYNDHVKNMLQRIMQRPSDNQSQSGCNATVTGDEQLSLVSDFSGMVIFGFPQKKVTIAFYSSNPNSRTSRNCKRIYKNLKDTLERFCNCDVFLFTGSSALADIDRLNSSTIVLVLCTKELYNLDRHLKTGVSSPGNSMVSVSRCQMMGKRILDILSPSNAEVSRQAESQHIAIIKLDGMPDYWALKLSTLNKTRARPVITLPSELEQLACYTDGTPHWRKAKYSRWSAYKRDPLYKNLLSIIEDLLESEVSKSDKSSDISNMVAGLDSGIGNSMTSRASHENIDTQNKDQPAHSGAHIKSEQLEECPPSYSQFAHPENRPSNISASSNNLLDSNYNGCEDSGQVSGIISYCTASSISINTLPPTTDFGDVSLSALTDPSFSSSSDCSNVADATDV